MGNAFRMTGNYNDAIKHFRQAERLYEDIGDIVSYSYTLWSFANVYKMKGDLLPARELLKKARRNFKKTRDPRGIIYCNLTLGEMEYMKGKSGRAEKLFRLALKEAVARGFKLETCHARMLLAVMAGGPSKTLSCYGRLGVRTMPSGIPCNMP
jgi:tetratricopeptide (TPR) repeat protein